LSDVAKDALRKEAREEIFYKAYPDLIGKDLQVHHRITLEWAHLFPEAELNRLSNLVGLDETIHKQISAKWSIFRSYYKSLGRSPTAKEILRFALKIDQEFSTAYNKFYKKVVK